MTDRAVGSRAIAGNAIRHFADSPAALAEMLALITAARRQVILENYIIRDDATGCRFADALLARAADGVHTRVLYDGLGCRGTSRGFWRRLRDGGVDVRVFGAFVPHRPFDYLVRNHRKLLTVDGRVAMLGGLCLGDEWAGDPVAGRMAWRDTSVRLEGPAVTALEHGHARVWRATGPTAAATELAAEATPAGDVRAWVIETRPGTARVSRAAVQQYDAAQERIWISDAYFVAPLFLGSALLDAARAGVDVRLLVPGTSDAPLVRDLTRENYRELLDAGVRVFEWEGPMLHAKTMLVDRRWARIGSSNLNAQSLYGNYELDLLVDSEPFAEEMAAQFRRDEANSVEIVRQPRRLRKPRLVVSGAAPSARPVRSLYERRLVATVVLRRVAWRVRRKVTAAAALALLGTATLLLVFQSAGAIVVALAAFAAGLPLALDAIRQRPVEMPEESPDTGPGR